MSKFFSVAVAVIALVTAVSSACKKDEAPKDVESYTVRGVVESINSDRSELMVHHEAIDDFVNREGKVKGMDSMTMPFPVGESADTGGLQKGDKVKMTFDVDWSREGSPLEIQSLEELPADTELDLDGRAEPMDHGEMDHGEMDHGEMDHGETDDGKESP